MSKENTISGSLSELQSQTIDWLRFPMAIMVVIIHCAGNLPSCVDWRNFDGLQFNYALRIAGSNVFTHLAVPLFFMISGFLFFKGINPHDDSVYLRKLRSRFHTLLIPYVLWISIALLFNLICIILGSLLNSSGWDYMKEWASENIRFSAFWNIRVWDSFRHNWLGMIYPQPCLASSPFLVPLWFIRNLIVMVAISPLLGRLISWGGKYIMTICLICYVSLIFPYFPGFDIESLFFYNLGIWLALNNMNLVVISRKFHKICILPAFFLGVALIYLNGYESYLGNIIYPFFIITGIISLFAISSYVIQIPKLRYVNKSILSMKETVFFVFASHTLFLRYIDLGMHKFISNDPMGEILSYLILPIITTIVCLLIYYGLKKSIPSVLSILTGGR